MFGLFTRDYAKNKTVYIVLDLIYNVANKDDKITHEISVIEEVC